MTTDIKIRGYAWTLEGKKVYVEAITQDGEYVVSGVIAQIYGDQIDEAQGETWVHHGQLYTKPPVEVVDEVIKVKQAELETLRKEHLDLTFRATSAEKEVKDRLAKLAKYRGLENIEAFLEGKVTHVVSIDYGGAHIKTFEELATYYEERGYNKHPAGVKLITLFGDSKGDLEWRINDYRDGSGSSRTMYPCAGHEDAVAKRNEILTDALTSAVAAPKDYQYRNKGIARAVENMLAAGLPVPEDAAAIATVVRDKQNAENRASLQKQIADLTARLDAIGTSSHA